MFFLDKNHIDILIRMKGEWHVMTKIWDKIAKSEWQNVVVISKKKTEILCCKYFCVYNLLRKFYNFLFSICFLPH